MQANTTKNYPVTKRLWIALLLSAFLLLCQPLIVSAQTLTLTPEEQAWLTEHGPEVQVSLYTLPPLQFKKGEQFTGYQVEVLEAILQEVGLKPVYSLGTVATVLSDLSEKRADLAIDFIKTKERSRYLLFSQEAIESYLGIFGRKDSAGLESIDSLKGKVIASFEDYGLEVLLKKHLPDARIIRAKDQQGMFRLVSSGQADAAIHPIATGEYILQKNMINNLISHGEFRAEGEARLLVHEVVVRKDLPQLMSIFDKAYASLDELKLQKIWNKWFVDKTPAPATSTVVLTPEEQAWIEGHPSIRVGLFPVAPYQFRQGGKITGYSVDLLKAICKLNGIVPEFTITPLGDLLKKLESGEEDLALILTYNQDRARYLAFSEKKFFYKVGIYARVDESRISNKESLNGKTIASYTGYALEGILKKYVPDATFIHAASAVEMFRLVETGKADATIHELHAGNYIIRENFINNLESKGVIETENPEQWLAYEYALRKDIPHLKEILDKSYGALGESEKQRIYLKWFGADTPAKDAKPLLNLTAEEQAWLDEEHAVKVRTVNWPPYMIVKDGEPPQGLAIEYLKLVGERTGINFSFEMSNKPFADFLKNIKAGHGPDLISTIVKTKERQEYLSFSEDYLTSPYVIFMRSEGDLLLDISGLADKTVAVPKGFYVQELLSRDYPNIEQVLFSSDEQALNAVATGKADAYIGNLTVASHIIERSGFSALRVAAPGPFGNQALAIGSRKDWPELTSIINKVLASITEEEKNIILNKYLSLKYEPGINRALVVKWTILGGGVIVCIILSFITWNWQLRARVRQRTADLKNEIVEREWTYKQLVTSEEKYRGLVDMSIVGVFSSGLDGQLLFVNDALARMFDFDNAEQMLVERTLPRWKDPEQRQRFLTELRERGSLSNVEVESVTRTGRTIYALVSATLHADSISGMLMDISERKSVEKDLISSQEKFYKVFQASLDAISVTNLATAKFVDVNKSFERVFGYSREEVLDKSSLDFNMWKNSEDRTRLMPEYLELRQLEVNELQLINKSGATIIADVNFVIMEIDGEDHSIAIISDVTDEKRTAQKINEHQKRLKVLAFKLTMAEEQERRFIAADLHDNVGQALTLSRVQLADAIQDCAEPGLSKKLQAVSKTLLKTIEDTSHLIFELSSPTLMELGLGAAIGEWAEGKLNNKQGVNFDLIDELGRLDLSENILAVLYRNVRELLTNTIKHARADRVKVILECINKELRITVQDNGCGFIPQQALSHMNPDGGFGLYSVQERMTDINGTLEINSKPYQGCKIVMSVPIA